MNDFRATRRSVWGFDLAIAELADWGRWRESISHPVSGEKTSYILFQHGAVVHTVFSVLLTTQETSSPDEAYKWQHCPNQKLIKNSWVYRFSVEIFLGFGPNSISLSIPIQIARICHNTIIQQKSCRLILLTLFCQWVPCHYIDVQ